MNGPQRHSLLDGNVLYREYSARDKIDEMLDRVVDAFDFKITTREDETVKYGFKIPRIGEMYGKMDESPSISTSSSFKTFQERKTEMVNVINKKLCQWILNESPEESNPLELGWSKNSHNNQVQDDTLLDYSDDEPNLECTYAIMC